LNLGGAKAEKIEAYRCRSLMPLLTPLLTMSAADDDADDDDDNKAEGDEAATPPRMFVFDTIANREAPGIGNREAAGNGSAAVSGGRPTEDEKRRGDRSKSPSPIPSPPPPPPSTLSLLKGRLVSTS
jgi:hypothetical protein